MERAPTSDWATIGWPYRALERVVRRPLLWGGRVEVLDAGRFLDLGDEGGVVAANHFTWYDPFAVSAVCPRPLPWIAKKEVYENVLGRWLFGSLGCIPVDRQNRGGNEDALGAAARAIEGGALVGIFPEGTRSQEGALRPAKSGVARLALRTGCAVLPVGVLANRYWPRGARRPARGEVVRVAVGEPVRYGRDPAGAEDAVRRREVGEDVMRRIEALVARCREASQSRERWARA